MAPGTAGSLAALAIGVVALWADPRLLVWMAIAATLAGIWAVHALGERGDPGWIVIDEFAGQWVAMIGLRHVSLSGVVAAFVLFRLFDIWKPGPVGWVDRRHGAVATMGDDVVAGAIAAAVLFVAGVLLPGF